MRINRLLADGDREGFPLAPHALLLREELHLDRAPFVRLQQLTPFFLIHADALLAGVGLIAHPHIATLRREIQAEVEWRYIIRYRHTYIIRKDRRIFRTCLCIRRCL